MSLSHQPHFYLTGVRENRVHFASDTGATVELFVLEDDIVRVLVLPSGQMSVPKTWAITPGGEDVPQEGRDRLSTEGFKQVAFEYLADDVAFKLSTSLVRLAFKLDGGLIDWYVKTQGEWIQVAADRKTQACNFNYWDEKIYHYLQRQKGEMYFGLGERAGALNRMGHRYEMRNIDAMGYNAVNTDPLYKHIPFYITWSPETLTGFGLFYDNQSDCVFDMGRELDNYHGPYRSYIAAAGDLDYYFIASPLDPIHAVRRFTWLTGRPALMPKWSIGYSGSTMSYTDAPDAHIQMQKFIDGCSEHDILCESFHLSSGYTSIGDKRYVFNWNHDKFPDIDAFVNSYLNAGIKICANIKPCLLRDHPQFEDLAQRGLFITDQQGAPLIVQFWDEVGAYLDFTNPNTIDWWKDQVKRSLLSYGIAATWNDNNEFEIWSANSVAHGFGAAFPAWQMKVLQTMLMMRASRDAQREYAPDLRPFLISRSGGAGMQRYVQTWSGDNYTSWDTLRYNLKMGLGLSLSGVSNSGHDIGGFSGPAPDQELFLRWIEFGILMPRFSIHSWNDDGTVNEPWMHPAITSKVSELIKLRGFLLPYLYDLQIQSNESYEPILLPKFACFPQDLNCYQENDDVFVGPALLFAPVVEPGAVQREVYLPQGQKWVSMRDGVVWEAGQVTIPAPLGAPVMLLREGSGIPVNLAQQTFSHHQDQRGFMIVPPSAEGEICVRCAEDDGLTESWRQGARAYWHVLLNASSSHLHISFQLLGEKSYIQTRVEIWLPESESRQVVFADASLEQVTLKSGWRRYALDITSVLNEK